MKTITIELFYVNVRNTNKTVTIEMQVNENDLITENGHVFMKNAKDFHRSVKQAKEKLNKQKKTFRTFYSYEILNVK
jgi:hypothetical protein